MKVYGLLILVILILSSPLRAQEGEAGSPEIRSFKAFNSGYRKPGAALVFADNLPSRIEPDQVVTFQLKVGETYDEGSLVLDLNAREIELLAHSLQARFDVATGGEHIMDISFRAPAYAGRYYINVIGSVSDQFGLSRRAHSIAVQVGDSGLNIKPSAPGRIEKMSSGRSVIVMDAVETINDKK